MVKAIAKRSFAPLTPLLRGGRGPRSELSRKLGRRCHGRSSAGNGNLGRQSRDGRHERKARPEIFECLAWKSGPKEGIRAKQVKSDVGGGEQVARVLLTYWGKE